MQMQIAQVTLIYEGVMHSDSAAETVNMINVHSKALVALGCIKVRIPSNTEISFITVATNPAILPF